MFGTRVTSEICIHVDIKNRINSGNGCLYSLPDLLCPQVICKNINIKITNYNFACYSVWMWNLVFYFEWRTCLRDVQVWGAEIWEEGVRRELERNCVMRKHIIDTFHKTLLEVISWEMIRWAGGSCGRHAGEEKYFRNFGEKQKGRELKRETGVYEPIIVQDLKI